MNAHEDSKIISLLLKNGADPKEENNHGVSPIEIAPEYFK